MNSFLFALPESVILLVANCLLIAGLIGLIISFILQKIPTFPTVIPYTLILTIISTTILVSGVYVRGYYSASEEMNTKIKNMEVKVERALMESKISTNKVEYVFLNRVKQVRDTQIIEQEKIRDISLTIDRECKVVPEVIDILNTSAKKGKK